MNDRHLMLRALRTAIMPDLRAAGFQGTLPHLRRLTPHKTDVLAVQFASGGGKFVLELAEGPAGPFRATDGKTLRPSEFTSYSMPLASRARLGPLWIAGGDGWFHFEGTGAQRFADAAERVRALLPQALLYWDGSRAQPNIHALFAHVGESPAE